MSGSSHKPTDAQQLESWATALRTLHQHEDNLLNSRLSALLAVHGFLFTAYAFSWRNSAIGPALVFCLIGILVVLLSFWSYLIGKKAQTGLKTHWDEFRTAKKYGGPDIVGYRSKEGDKLTKHLRPWRLGLAIVIGISWFVLLALAWHVTI